jgi:hypothetical protein
MSFAAATAVQRVVSGPGRPGRFTAEVSAGWTIAGKPNGGYLLAQLTRAAGLAGPHPHAIAASAHYLSSPSPGPVEIEIDVLRGGRNVSQLRARMVQDARPCIEALVTTSTLAAGEAGGPRWTGGVPAPDVADFDSCVRVPAVAPNGLAVPMMNEVELRLDPAVLGFASGRPSGAGELRGWLTLLDGEEVTPDALVYAVDAFPPATFEIATSGWVPTLELTVYVRALPAPGSLRVLQLARSIDAGRVDEACFVWDSTDRLVAQGTQLAGIRFDAPGGGQA